MRISYPKYATKNRRRKGISRAIAISLFFGVIAAVGLALDYWSAVPNNVSVDYIGRAACIECHQDQVEAWSNSPHDLAMETATGSTVLASFENVELQHEGVASRMYRDGERFMARTEGPDGELHDYHIQWVFGNDPLQQYMVELEPTGSPDEFGKVQVLRWSWDTQQEKWFYLPPPDVDEKLEPDDPLHWTGFAQNWNHMCADCHSTNLRKNFDPKSIAYHTTFSEIDVSCETCHGPGSLHTELANAKSVFWDRKRGKGLKATLKKGSNVAEIQACAPCHARRQRYSPAYEPGDDFYDHYSVQLLTPDTYYPDGQIRDEVYVYGSFIQSKMFAKDIRCSDCHNPHTTKVKFEDNRLCTSCHQHSAAKYDTPAHHHHEVGSSGASCIECHMPASPFMEIDLRRDHQLGVPRPDLSVRFQTPNACTGCHLHDSPIAEKRCNDLQYYADWLEAARNGDGESKRELQRLDKWAEEQVIEWYGDLPRDVETTEAFHLAWQGASEGSSKIFKVADDRKRSGLVRASAIALLQQYRSSQADLIAQRGLSDREPLVRATSAQYFSRGDITERLQLLSPLLTDPIRLVRVQAAEALADVPQQTLIGETRVQFAAAMEERKKSLLVDSDQAGSHTSLAQLAERQRNPIEAAEHYVDAIRVQPGVTGPRSNLAALMERLNRPEDAKRLRKDELPLLKRDAGLAPDNAPLQYRLGLALYLAGEMAEAETALLNAIKIEPENTDYLMFVALLYEKLERWDEAVEYGERMVVLAADNPAVVQTLQRLKAKAVKR